MKLPAVKRLSYDNVPEEQQQAVQTIANIINPFMDDVHQILNGNVGFDNTTFKTARFSVKTDANGAIIGQLIIATGLTRPPFSVIIGDIKMTANPDAVVNIDNTPFLLQRPISANTIKVDKILNLKPNSDYTISVLFF